MATHGFKTGNAFCRLNSKVSTEGPIIITLIDITDDEATVFLNIQAGSIIGNTAGSLGGGFINCYKTSLITVGNSLPFGTICLQFIGLGTWALLVVGTWRNSVDATTRRCIIGRTVWIRSDANATEEEWVVVETGSSVPTGCGE
jgi:hypothetical protein